MRNPEDDVIDAIGALIDEQMDRPYRERSGYDNNINQDECSQCGAPWHGLTQNGCPGVTGKSGSPVTTADRRQGDVFATAGGDVDTRADRRDTDGIQLNGQPMPPLRGGYARVQSAWVTRGAPGTVTAQGGAGGSGGRWSFNDDAASLGIEYLREPELPPVPAAPVRSEIQWARSVIVPQHRLSATYEPSERGPIPTARIETAEMHLRCVAEHDQSWTTARLFIECQGHGAVIIKRPVAYALLDGERRLPFALVSRDNVDHFPNMPVTVEIYFHPEHKMLALITLAPGVRFWMGFRGLQPNE
ncbi:Uncharacterised protein [Mycobacteroides abscessus subsp. massiliense]|uniref:hypothetical protein n=1 Tax=Mycobacteroides abscessus TaxID=36809 RepID=UPI0009A627E6|nr:hypothetical protein [Mycobacteroides abscessus]SKM81529.1 Uncharacterised protein [Mycobacteroides abscessus subsp. massiliense]SKM98156.1 Uncharacterised protein [Mycobacteroides abscessus subsp. massiliense]SKN76855.1 Uncharacterised protein [Mycobacteroides abscessus subsp. massiliense]SKN96250.1 Uncharacterised protein [Mycobacteroides abscessus subsp. massiliense]SKO21674.1 Uncharacterised protein [Mycobacteroides abscessus subsp. massiliense]